MGMFDNAGDVVLPATDYYSSNVPDEYAIRKALAMLHGVGFAIPDRVVVNDPPSSASGRDVARRSGIQHNAYVDPNETGHPVHVNAYTSMYEDARKAKPGALILLASVLAHEAQHQTGGPDEQAAYDQQLRVLAALGANSGAVRTVRAAANYVKQQKESQ